MSKRSSEDQGTSASPPKRASVGSTGQSSKPTVLIDQQFPPQQQQFLQERANVVVLGGEHEADWTYPPIDVCATVEAILWYGHAPVTGEIMDRFPNLKVVRSS